MRFSITTVALMGFALGSNAKVYDPAYVSTWGITTDSHGVLGRTGPPLLFDNSGTDVYMAQLHNTKRQRPPPPPSPVDPGIPFRLQFVGVTGTYDGKAITAAKIVEYPGYSTEDKGLYLWQSEGGSLVYSKGRLGEGEYGPWWLKEGPANDLQFRLSLDGDSTAKVLWDESKGRYKVYVGSNIPANLTGQTYDIDIKLTEFCGPGENDYCSLAE